MNPDWTAPEWKGENITDFTDIWYYLLAVLIRVFRVGTPNLIIQVLSWVLHTYHLTSNMVYPPDFAYEIVQETYGGTSQRKPVFIGRYPKEIGGMKKKGTLPR